MNHSHDEIVGMVIRDAHNSFWIKIGAHIIPVSVDQQQAWARIVPARSLQCQYCNPLPPAV